MSEEQLAALLAKLKDDAELQEKLQGSADLDAAVTLVKEEGFDVSKADLLRYQANQTLELSDEEPEGVAGGGFMSLCWGGNQVLLVRLLPGGCMLSKPFYGKDDRQQQAHWLASGLISMPKN